MEEVRAYNLLRHSQLPPEDKKRVVIESEDNLKYKETVKAMRLLGSKIFWRSSEQERRRKPRFGTEQNLRPGLHGGKWCRGCLVQHCARGGTERRGPLVLFPGHQR